MPTQLPAELLQSLKGLNGFDEAAFTAVHQSGEQITSVRVNQGKILNDQLSILNNQSGRVKWTEAGYYLQERPSFTLDPLFHAGAYYVQEASSMFLEQALKQTVDLSKSIKVLDLCAAPGGKSTLIQSLISKESLLVSNEVIKARVNILAENISKWGAANVIVTNNDPQHFQRLENYFDVIVVDAPCSGSGLFRKDANAIDEWSENNVALCSRRQQRILADIMASIKDGGVLIYSTCSYNKEEDEQISDWIMEEFKVQSLKFKVEEAWNIIETVSEKYKASGYRFYPDKVKGEGFFIAAFKTQHVGEDNTNQKGKRRSKKEKISPAETEIIRPYLKKKPEFFLYKAK